MLSAPALNLVTEDELRHRIPINSSLVPHHLAVRAPSLIPFPRQQQRCSDSRNQFDTHQRRGCNKWLRRNPIHSIGGDMNNISTGFFPPDRRLLTETIVEVNVDGKRSGQQIFQTLSPKFCCHPFHHQIIADMFLIIVIIAIVMNFITLRPATLLCPTYTFIVAVRSDRLAPFFR